MPRSPILDLTGLTLEDTRKNTYAPGPKKKDYEARPKETHAQAKVKPSTGRPIVKRTGDGGAGNYQARKNALYASARRSAKELVQSGMSMMEEMQAKLEGLKAQESTFQKYHDDFKAPRLTVQEVVGGLGAVYAPMLDELGQQRSETLEEASTMLQQNAPRRQSALREFSKNARQQLEQFKQQEKDAEDASNLIKHYKNLLRG